VDKENAKRVRGLVVMGTFLRFGSNYDVRLTKSTT